MLLNRFKKKNLLNLHRRKLMHFMALVQNQFISTILRIDDAFKFVYMALISIHLFVSIKTGD